MDDYVVKDMRNAGIREAEGVKFTVESKMEMAQWLKQCMVEKRLRIPYGLKPSASRIVAH
ncbi:MAG: hypothetical protein QXI39_04140 [Candidatus Bathyarchaeia archaeon]